MTCVFTAADNRLVNRAGFDGDLHHSRRGSTAIRRVHRYPNGALEQLLGVVFLATALERVGCRTPRPPSCAGPPPATCRHLSSARISRVARRIQRDRGGTPHRIDARDGRARPTLGLAIPRVLDCVVRHGRPAYVCGKLNLEVLGADITILSPTNRVPIGPGRQRIVAFWLVEFL